MRILRTLVLSVILLSSSSCATAYWAGGFSGAIETNNVMKMVQHTTSTPFFVAVDVAGLPFLTIVLLTGGDGWPTQEEYRKGYEEGKKPCKGGGEGFKGIPFLTPVFR